MLGLVKLVRGVQQRLGRDTAHVQTGAAQCIAPFDHGGFQPKLGAADGADIAAGTGADYDNVIVCHVRSSFPGIRAVAQGQICPFL